MWGPHVILLSLLLLPPPPLPSLFSHVAQSAAGHAANGEPERHRASRDVSEWRRHDHGAEARERRRCRSGTTLWTMMAVLASPVGTRGTARSPPPRPPLRLATDRATAASAPLRATSPLSAATTHLSRLVSLATLPISAATSRLGIHPHCRRMPELNGLDSDAACGGGSARRSQRLSRCRTPPSRRRPLALLHLTLPTAPPGRRRH